MNTEAVLRVAEAIENGTIPGVGFNMKFWSGEGSYAQDRLGRKCDCAACIGGTTELLFRDVWPREIDGAVGVSSIFGISCAMAIELCYPEQDGNSNAAAYDATPQQAGQVLRHLAATGVVDWSVMS